MVGPKVTNAGERREQRLILKRTFLPRQGSPKRSQTRSWVARQGEVCLFLDSGGTLVLLQRAGLAGLRLLDTQKGSDYAAMVHLVACQ